VEPDAGDALLNNYRGKSASKRFRKRLLSGELMQVTLVQES
jgi:hypothetical protein